MPDFEYPAHDGDLTVEHPVAAWVGENHADLDWIFFGVLRKVMERDQLARKNTAEFADRLEKLDKQEEDIFIAGIRAVAAGVDNETAMAEVEKQVAAYWADKAA